MEAIRSKGSCLSEASFLVLVLNYGGWDLGHDWSSPRLGGPGRFGGRGEEGEESKCSGVARWIGGWFSGGSWDGDDGADREKAADISLSLLGLRVAVFGFWAFEAV